MPEQQTLDLYTSWEAPGQARRRTRGKDRCKLGLKSTMGLATNRGLQMKGREAGMILSSPGIKLHWADQRQGQN